MTQKKIPKKQIIIQCINLSTCAVNVSVKCISTAIFSRFRNSLFRVKTFKCLDNLFSFTQEAQLAVRTNWSLFQNIICNPETCRPNVLCTKTYRQLNVVSSPFLYQIQEPSKSLTHRHSSRNEIVTIGARTLGSNSFSGNERMVGEQPKSSAREKKNFYAIIKFFLRTHSFFRCGISWLTIFHPALASAFDPFRSCTHVLCWGLSSTTIWRRPRQNGKKDDKEEIPLI